MVPSHFTTKSHLSCFQAVGSFLFRTEQFNTSSPPCTLMTSALFQAKDLAAANPIMPEQLVNRGADKWRPLLAIAEAAGEDWAKRARAAISELQTEEEDRPAHIKLLCRVATIIQDWPDAMIPSGDLDRAIAKLRAREDLGELSAKRRAQLLKDVGLKPERFWRGDKQLRGYRVSDIKKAAERYLGQDTCDA